MPVWPLPPFERSDRPWFGPTRRAQNCLRDRTWLATPERALAALIAALGEHGRHVQRVRFIDFRHRQRQGFRFTIALTWVASDPAARQAVYELGPSFAKSHGWYPLVQGARIGSKQAIDARSQRLRRRSLPRFGVRGDLHRVSSAVPADGGCAVRVHTRGGSLLLDTGLPGAFADPTDDALVLLSHVHRDHSGNLEAPGLAAKPIVMSLGTAHSLVTAGVIEEERLLSRAVIAYEDRDLQIGQGVKVRAFPVPHCPGATGFLLRDRTAALFYTGDICLATARHDFLPELVARVHADPARRRTVLLDATMAGRKEGASGAAAAMQVRELLGAVPDVVICSRDASQLLYAHLDLFATGKTDPATRTGVSTIMTPRARPLMRLLHAAFIDRAEERLDPLLVAQYGRSMSAWAETRWLYWLDELTSPPTDGARIWLLHPDELGAVPTTTAALAFVGGGADTVQEAIPTARIDTSPWTQHSDAPTLVRAVRQLAVHARVLLFHNFPRRLEAFIAANALPECRPLRNEPHGL
jgi:glyoxylase-like metal-dependent hydrolase (beta-lactamase superfamily II)